MKLVVAPGTHHTSAFGVDDTSGLLEHTRRLEQREVDVGVVETQKLGDLGVEVVDHVLETLTKTRECAIAKTIPSVTQANVRALGLIGDAGQMVNLLAQIEDGVVPSSQLQNAPFGVVRGDKDANTRVDEDHFRIGACLVIADASAWWDLSRLRCDEVELLALGSRREELGSV
jgi:hypothetical protein